MSFCNVRSPLSCLFYCIKKRDLVTMLRILFIYIKKSYALEGGSEKGRKGEGTCLRQVFWPSPFSPDPSHLHLLHNYSGLVKWTTSIPWNRTIPWGWRICSHCVNTPSEGEGCGVRGSLLWERPIPRVFGTNSAPEEAILPLGNYFGSQRPISICLASGGLTLFSKG